MTLSAYSFPKPSTPGRILGGLTELLRRTLQRRGGPKQIPLPPVVGRAREGVSVVAIFRDEASYLAEWIEFHLVVGVTHLVFYDNGSTDDSLAVLEPYVRRGLVTVIPWRAFARDVNVQRLAYAHAVANFASQAAWMAFIDVDEFLFSEKRRSLPDALGAYADAGALYVPRYEFGPSGCKKRPAGLVTESYTHRATWGEPTVKSIVRPHLVTSVGTHHTHVNGRERTIGTAAHDLRINHYFTKSEAEFEAKLRRGWPQGASCKLDPKWELYEQVTRNTVGDAAALPIAKAVADRLLR